MPLFLAFLLVPLIEIGLFIQVGGWIGLWPTLGIVVLTAILGSWLVRTQGLMAMGKLRSSFSTLQDPTAPLADGAMILFAGALLLTPGFFTDAFGFALLMPPVRAAVYKYVRARVKVQTFDMGGQRHDPRQSPADKDVIDVEFKEVGPNDPPSEWTKH